MPVRASAAIVSGMYSSGHSAMWSAKLVQPQAKVGVLQPVDPVNVMVRVIYNTLDGIINDYFVITASVAKR